jgi:hypothetical protein
VYVYIDIVAGFCFTLSAIVKKKLRAYVYVYSLHNLVGFGNFFSWTLYSSPSTHAHTHTLTGWQVSATGDTVLICHKSFNLTHSGYSSNNQCNQEVPCDVWQGLVFRIVSVYKLHCEHCNCQNVHEWLWPWLHEGRAGARERMLCKYLIPMEALLVLLLEHCKANATHLF